MAKKNKDIEIEVVEATENGVELQRLILGKKTIGEVRKIDDRKYEVYVDDELKLTTKSFEQGVEEVIAQWNLFQ